MKRTNPQTSIEAYRSLKIEDLNEIYRLILSALNVITEGTFEEIAAHLRIDKARIWKRMSELERMELVYRPGNKRLLKSNRLGYTWMLRGNGLPKTEKAEKLLSGQTVSDYSKKIQELGKSSVPKQVDMF